MTSQITSPSSDVNFGYNSNNERLVKSDLSAGSSILYLRGLNDYPLYEKNNSAEESSFDKIYIYGPTGLIAIKRTEGTHFILKDHLGNGHMIEPIIICISMFPKVITITLGRNCGIMRRM